jgi:hypothetical protein
MELAEDVMQVRSPIKPKPPVLSQTTTSQITMPVPVMDAFSTETQHQEHAKLVDPTWFQMSIRTDVKMPPQVTDSVRFTMLHAESGNHVSETLSQIKLPTNASAEVEELLPMLPQELAHVQDTELERLIIEDLLNVNAQLTLDVIPQIRLLDVSAQTVLTIILRLTAALQLQSLIIAQLDLLIILNYRDVFAMVEVKL